MYLPLEIFCLAVIGLLTGMAAGILGIGGGIIFVPTVYYFYSLQNVDPEIAIKSAIGTSLAVIFFTAISGAYSHFQKRNYIEKALIWIVSGSMIGAFVGAKIALLIHGKNLNVIIGTLLFLVSIRMFLENKRNDSNDDETSIFSPSGFVLIGMFSGIASGIMGAGGGVILVPALSIFMKQGIHKTIGTSAMVIIFTSAAACSQYLFSKNHIPVQYAIGYVNYLMAASFIPMSMIGARIGVNLALKTNPIKIRKIFAVFVFIIGIDISGLVDVIKSFL